MRHIRFSFAQTMTANKLTSLSFKTKSKNMHLIRDKRMFCGWNWAGKCLHFRWFNATLNNECDKNSFGENRIVKIYVQFSLPRSRHIICALNCKWEHVRESLKFVRDNKTKILHRISTRTKLMLWLFRMTLTFEKPLDYVHIKTVASKWLFWCVFLFYFCSTNRLKAV